MASHLGRPKGGYEEKFSLAPVIPRLSELLGQQVTLVPDPIGISVGKFLFFSKLAVKKSFNPVIIKLGFRILKSLSV